MNNYSKPILIISILIFLCSCATKKQIYRASSKRVIIIENDSILRHSELIGCLGNSNTLNYKNENGILKIAGNKNTKQEGIFSLATDLYGSELKMEKDSLINIKTGEIFYEEKYFKSKAENSFEKFYIVLDGKKRKIKKSNIERILTNPYLKNYEIVEMKRDEAKKEYGINTKYKTLKFVRK
jgi:hypothetical protein